MPWATISASGSTPSASARSALITTVAAAPSDSCEAFPAVMVPSGPNAGGSAASVSEVVSGRMPSSRSTTLVPPRAGTSTATTSSANRPDAQASAARSCERAAHASWSRAGDPQDVVDLVGGLAHVLAGEGRPQPVVDHRVHQLGRPHAGAPAGRGRDVGGVGHRLHPAGDHDLELAGPDQLVGQGHRGQARQAHLVEGDGRHLHRDAGRDRRLAGGDLAGPRLEHLAHEHVVDLAGRHPGPRQRAGDGDRPQLDGRAGPQRRTEPANRRSDRTDDHRARHVSTHPRVESTLRRRQPSRPGGGRP